MTNLTIANNFTLPIDAVSQKFGILAVSGAGKTYAASVLAEEMLQHNQQVVIIDPLGVWHGLRTSADGKSAGYKIIVVGGSHQDVPLEVASGKILADFAVDTGQSIILDLSELKTKAEEIRFAYEFAEQLYRRKKSDTPPLHLIWDEADLFAPQKPGPDQTKLLGSLENIVRRGRAKGLGVTLITQRSAVLNKNVLTQIETLIVLRTTAPQDQKAIEEWITYFGTAEERKAIMTSLPSLKTGQAWIYSPSWLRVCEQVTIRARKTFDSSSTPKVGAKKVEQAKRAVVDIDKLRTELAGTIQKAKENDPVELKKRIAELEKQAKAKTPAAAPVIDRAAIDKAVKIALANKEKECKEIAAVLSKAHTAFQKWKKDTNDVFEQVMNALGKANLLSAPIGIMGGDILKINELSKPVVNHTPVQRSSTVHIAGGSAGDQKLGTGQMRNILITLAQNQNGLSDKQVALNLGIKSSTGTFGTYLSTLRSNSWITGSRSLLQITEDGLNALGDYDPLPTGEDLFIHWQNKLGNGQLSKIFEIVYRTYPQTVSDVDIAAQLGISHTTGTFGTYLSTLRTYGLITGTRSDLKASDTLFD